MQETIDESLGLTVTQNTTDYSPVRLYGSRIIYLNKSNTKWILIGVLPGADFTRAAYICGKDAAIRIPDLEAFLAKLGEVYIVGLSGSSVVIGGSSPGVGNLTMSKTDFGTGTFQIQNSADNQRSVYVANIDR